MKKRIITPAAKFCSVSFRANPTARPAAPKIARNEVISTPTIESTEIIKAICSVIDNNDRKNGTNDLSIFLLLRNFSKILITLLIALFPTNKKIRPSKIFGEYSIIRLNKYV